LSSGAEPEVAQAAGTVRIRPRSRSVVSRRWCFLDETKTDHCLTKALKTSKIKRTTKAIIPTGSVASANQLRKIPTSIDLLTICGSHKTLVEAPEVKSHPSTFAKITDSMPIKSGDSDKTMIATETLIDSLRINGAGSCRECCGNSLTARSGHVIDQLFTLRGQGAWVQGAETGSPSRRPCASGFGRRRAAPRAAWARSRRRAARSGS
jgi:hypothetical protein